jgi:hypothetical protein
MSQNHCYARLRLLLKFRDFMNWVDINQKKEKLTCVNRIDNAGGKGLIEKTIQLKLKI